MGTGAVACRLVLVFIFGMLVLNGSSVHGIDFESFEKMVTDATFNMESTATKIADAVTGQTKVEREITYDNLGKDHTRVLTSSNDEVAETKEEKDLANCKDKKCGNGGIYTGKSIEPCDCRPTQFKGPCCEDKVKIFGYECLWTKYEWDSEPLPVPAIEELVRLKVPSYLYFLYEKPVRSETERKLHWANHDLLVSHFNEDRYENLHFRLINSRPIHDTFSDVDEKDLEYKYPRRDWWYGGYGSEYEGCLKVTNLDLNREGSRAKGRVEEPCRSCQPELHTGWIYGIEANDVEKVMEAEASDDYDFEVLISYGMFFGGSAGHAALVLKSPETEKPYAYSGNFYADSETNFWGRRIQDPENFYDGESLVDVTTKEMYLFKTSSNHGKGGSFGIEFGAIYRRHLYGLRFHQPNRTAEWVEKLQKAELYLKWMNEDFHNRDNPKHVRKTNLKMKYYNIEELNCASVIGAALEYAFDTNFDLLTTTNQTDNRPGGVFDTDTPLTLTNAMMEYFAKRGVGVTGVLYQRQPENAYVHRMQDEFTPTKNMQSRFPTGANWDYMRPKEQYVGPHDLFMASLFRRIMVRKVQFDGPAKPIPIECFDPKLSAAEKQDCAQDAAPSVVTNVDRTQNVYYGLLFSEERNDIFKEVEKACCEKQVQACCHPDSFSECETSICFLQDTNFKLYKLARSLSKKETGGYLQTFGDWLTFFLNFMSATLGGKKHPLLSELY
eukprot:Nk52_evm2s628 gene=Nk52_evmTU2s628